MFFRNALDTRWMKYALTIACAFLASCATTVQSTSTWHEAPPVAKVERKLGHQDRLLSEARAHEKAGDYDRALQRYEDLIQTDKTGKLAPLLHRDMAKVDAKRRAVKQARELALGGRHADAIEHLEEELGSKDAAEVALPWKVETSPAGARARLEDGTQRVTPFTVESTWCERVRFTLTLGGYESQELTIEHPADQSVTLSPLSGVCTSW
jgi:hypothetical protein